MAWEGEYIGVLGGLVLGWGDENEGGGRCTTGFWGVWFFGRG